MAKVKGFNPPVTKLEYEEEDGSLHYFGAFMRMIFGEGFVSPIDPTKDIIGESRRGSRLSQKGEGTAGQVLYRKAFKDCTLLWNAMPEWCPDPLPPEPVTAKESVWFAKIEHGVVCSYYDLFMRCCMKYAFGHEGAMPVGDCFPCAAECVEDPAMNWDYATSAATIARNSSEVVAISGLNFPFSWSVAGTGFSLEHETTEGLTNTLHADGTACGSATITVTGCDDNSTTGYVRGTEGEWVLIDMCTQNGGDSTNCIDSYIGNIWRHHCARCCKPEDCGEDRTCCDWAADWYAICAYCDSNPNWPEYTSTRSTTRKYEWKCQE